MDAIGVVFRQPLSFSSSSCSVSQSSSNEFRTSAPSMCVRSRRPASQILSYGFCNQGHIEYYNLNHRPSLSSKASSVMMMMMSSASGQKEKTVKDKSAKKMKKKHLKLLKALSRDLSTFSQLGFGLDSDGALLDQVKGNMISEAAELMLKQLHKLKAEEKELKSKKKEEKARLKAALMQNNVISCGIFCSSSSSESSSDRECGEIVDMNNLKSEQALQQETTTLTVIPTVAPVSESNVFLERSSTCNVEEKNDCRKMSTSSPEKLSSLDMPKRIEVCMGGKCKKSGAGTLLTEFQKAVGIEGTVSGCKCMGMCRDGPNVKVLNGFNGSAKASNNSLRVGVGLEDVDMIVASFLGENHNQNQVGFAAATC